MNIFVKKLGHFPSQQAVFFRVGIALVFMLGLLRARGIPLKGHKPALLIGRGIAGTMALYLYFLSLQYMPLATAVTFQYLSPIFTSVLAIFLLSESMRPIQWIFYGLSFTGVLLIKGNDARIETLPLVIAITSAFFSALAYNLVRMGKGSDHPLVIVTWFMGVSTILTAPFCIHTWVAPSAIDMVYAIAMSAFSLVGQFFLTKALQSNANANIVSSLNYLGILYALAFGWFLFGESYDLTVVMGMIFVVAGVAANVFGGKSKSTAKEATDG